MLNIIEFGRKFVTCLQINTDQFLIMYITTNEHKVVTNKGYGTIFVDELQLSSEQ